MSKYSEAVSDIIRKNLYQHMKGVYRTSEAPAKIVANTVHATFDVQQRYIDSISRNQLRAINEVTKSMLRTQQTIASGAAKRVADAGEDVMPKLTDSLDIGGLTSKQAQSIAEKVVREVRSEAKRHVEAPAPNPEEVRELLAHRSAGA